VLRHVLTVFLAFLLSACNGPIDLPVTVQPSPTAIPQITATPASERTDQDTQLFDYDAYSVVRITESSSTQQDGYTIHDIHYPSPKTGDVPAYLVVPDGDGPFAGMILMHGSSGSRETLLPLAEDFAKTGAVVLTLSAPPVRTGRSWISFTPRDRDDQIQLMLDLRRGVDLLSQHEKVDPDRLGYIGYSYGAAMGGLLAGIEPRIKAYGLMVGDGGLVNHFTDDGEPVGGFETIDLTARELWLEAMEPIEPIHFVGRASPSALYFQNARFDSSVSEEDALAYQAAASEPKMVTWYDSGHGLPEQAYIDMAHWMAEQIGIDASKFKPSR
jgi:predicted esterase